MSENAAIGYVILLAEALSMQVGIAFSLVLLEWECAIPLLFYQLEENRSGE